MADEFEYTEQQKNTLRDLELVLRAQQGESDAFGELYDLYGEKIYAFFLVRVRRVPTAEDLTSTTFFKALEGLAKFRSSSDASFSGWIYAIARHVLADHWRGTKIHEDLEDTPNLLSDDSPLEHAEQALRAAETSRMLSSLSSTEQEIIRLRLWDECSYKEIAVALDKTEAACKMGYGRALKKLATLYERA